jgi:CRISPR-associated protein Cmr1
MQRTFNLEVTTALFMHGADPRGQSELRPPAFKGQMRYWFRALAGAYYPLPTLHNLEDRLFGSTMPDPSRPDPNKGNRLMVRLTQPRFVDRDNRDLLPHQENERQRGSKNAILQGNSFSLTLLTHRSNYTQADFDMVSWALWLAVNLGGFGQRSRRGAGSLRLLDINPSLSGLPFQPEFATIEDLGNYLRAGLQAAQGNVRRLTNTSTVPASILPGLAAPVVPPADPILAEFPIIAPACAAIRVASLSAQDEQQARLQVMRGLRGHKNVIFGIPYMRTGSGDAGYTEGRHASPLHLHLTPLTSSPNPNRARSYALVQTVLYNEFLNLPYPVADQLNKVKMQDYLNSYAGSVVVL